VELVLHGRDEERAVSLGLVVIAPSPGIGLLASDFTTQQNSFEGPSFHWGAVLDNVHNWTFTGNSFPGGFSGPSVSSICPGGGQIGGGTIPSPARKCAKNHVTGSSSIQSTCGALAGGESLHEVLLSN
jgi:hypothetical protein